MLSLCAFALEMPSSTPNRQVANKVQRKVVMAFNCGTAVITVAPD